MASSLRSAIFLDRDGVLVEAPIVEGLPKSITKNEEVQYLVGIKSSLQALKSAGFLLIMVTNQPDIARHKITFESAFKLNESIGTELNLDAIYMCPHDNQDNCACRKPSPGLINRAALDLNIDVASSYLIGDRWRDISAGQAAGCKCLFLNHGYSEERPEPPYDEINSISQATSLILGEK